jgi:diguanylate cyclase (GGDEF)-like protein/PAS domain S-box-containing protein
MATPLRVLIVEDHAADAALIVHELGTAGFEPAAQRVDSQADYLAALGPELDIILCDYHLPQFDAFRALDLMHERGLDIPFIIVSGSIGEEIAVSGIKRGATDYLLKDRLARLGQAVGQALEQRRLREETRRAEAALDESRERYRELFEEANDVIYTHDLDGNFTTINKAGERISGYTREEFLVMNIAQILPPKYLDLAREMIDRKIADGAPTSYELEVQAKDGRRVPLEVSTHLIYKDGRPVEVQGIARDIAERKRAEEQISFLVYHDKLTGLPNRAMVEELLDLALARARRHDLAVAVVYLDLDNFKLVNDSLGHAAGDDLLRHVASRLSEISRETDLVARLGGDEFLLLVADLERGPSGGHEGPDHALLVARSVATRVHECLRAPFVIAGTECYTSASIGVSVFPLDAEDGPILLKNADAAMYQSKKHGPGDLAFFASEPDDPVRTLSFATRLRQAVDAQQWVLHHQPIVDLVTSRMVGVEALIRWREADGRLTKPDEFIPQAEEMGLIEPIGDWVLQQLCRESGAWRRSGLDVDVSFNLSLRQLWHPDLTQKVLTRLKSADVDPTRIIIEITESAAMADPDRTRQTMWDLHAHGLRFAIDDFGTGYSSLSRLKNLPVNILKIDRSFVRDLPGNHEAETTVKAIIQLALGLGMTPLAEGIETEEQRGFLVAHDCSLGQGFCFSPAIPAPELVERFDSHGLDFSPAPSESDRVPG